MNVKIGVEAAQFPEKEYITRIAVAVLQMPSIHPPETALSMSSVRFHFLATILGLRSHSWLCFYKKIANVTCNKFLFYIL
jgi:hypothetical protein